MGKRIGTIESRQTIENSGKIHINIKHQSARSQHGRTKRANKSYVQPVAKSGCAKGIKQKHLASSVRLIRQKGTIGKPHTSCEKRISCTVYPSWDITGRTESKSTGKGIHTMVCEGDFFQLCLKVE